MDDTKLRNHEGRSIHALEDSIRWFSDSQALRGPLIRVLKSNQKMKSPHLEVMAIATAFFVVTEALKLDRSDILQQVKNMRAELNSPNVNEWRAIIDYCRGEILNGRS